MGQLERVDGISVSLNCTMCIRQFTDVDSAKLHFNNEHKGANIDITAYKTTDQRNPNSDGYLILKIKSFILQQHFICDHDQCRTTCSTKARLIAHHQQDHKGLPLAARFSPLLYFHNLDSKNLKELTAQNLVFDRYILYSCAHCEDPIIYFNQPMDVKMHWLKKHYTKDLSVDETFYPFRYKALPLVSCKYCKLLTTFTDLMRHHQEKHQDNPLVAVDPFNENQCSVCHFSDGNVINHFIHEHPLVSQKIFVNPICYDVNTFMELVKVNVGPKFRCEVCDDILQTEDDLGVHHTIKHEALKYRVREIYDDIDEKLMGGCCNKQVIERHRLFEHILEHRRNFYCQVCSYHTTNSFEFVEHGITAHGIHSDARTVDLDYLKRSFWKSRFIWMNGLVLNKHNLIKTYLDDSTRFKRFLAEQEKKYNARES